MGRSRYKIVTEGKACYFATSSIINWISIFSNPEIVKIILDSLKFLHESRRLVLHAYVIMENHLHVIASSADFSKEFGDFKSYTARKIIDYLEACNVTYVLNQLKFYKKLHKKTQIYQLWQEGYHPQLIQNEYILRQKLDYIHFNPVKRGYIDDPAFWRYSSYRNYTEGEGIIPVEIIGL